MKERGSILVSLLLLLSAAIVCSINLLKSSWLLSDIMGNKELYYQHHYATEGLLRCGCTIASHNKDRLMSHAGLPITITFTQWPITDTKRGVGIITIITKTKTEIMVCSQLCVDNNPVCVRSCRVRVPEQAEGAYELPATISDWSTQCS